MWLTDPRRFFVHGSTYEDHPVTSAAALCVQDIIDSEGLVENVRMRGEQMRAALQQRLGDHPCVCDIRGRGLFFGVRMLSSTFAQSQMSDRIHRSSLRSHIQRRHTHQV